MKKGLERLRSGFDECQKSTVKYFRKAFLFDETILKKYFKSNIN
jgi:hypothetical protein